MTRPFDIVHIGYHKTGSSWFQQRLYPRVKSHRYLADRDEIKRTLVQPHAFAFNAQLAHDRLKLRGDAPVILCEENLSGSFETGGHMGALSKEYAHRVHALLPRAQIIIFVRHQVDIIASAYMQYVRRGGTHPVRRFLFPGRYRKSPWRDPTKRPLFAFEHFDYVGLVGHYDKVFGSANVHVFAFESLKENPQGFVGEFAERLRLELDLAEVQYGAANAAFRHRTLVLARFINRASYGAVTDKSYIVPSRGYRGIERFLMRFDASRLGGESCRPGRFSVPRWSRSSRSSTPPATARSRSAPVCPSADTAIPAQAGSRTRGWPVRIARTLMAPNKSQSRLPEPRRNAT